MPLSAADCYHLGVEAQKSKDYHVAMEWLLMSLQTPEEEPGDGPDKSHVLMEIVQTYSW